MPPQSSELIVEMIMIWQFHRGLKGANSFRVTRSPISTSSHGNDVSLIFAFRGRQAQLEPGVRYEIFKAFHAGLIEWEMLSKQTTPDRQQMSDPRSRAKAQLRTWTNVLHAPLNRRIKCLPRPWFEARHDPWFLIAFLSALMKSWPNSRKFPHRWPRVNFGNY